MRKILITEEQKKAISEALGLRVQIPSFLFKDIREGNTPLSDCAAIPNYGTLLDIAAKRYDEVKSAFSDDITSFETDKIFDKLSRLTTKCISIEANARKELEKYCINALIENFKIPEDALELSCNLVPEISRGKQFHIKPDTDEEVEYDNYESIELADSESKKRCIIDALIVGGSMRMSEKFIGENISSIFMVDEELPHLYSQIMKINDYLVFTQNIEIKDESHKQGGYVDVSIGDDVTKTKIKAEAVIFPILLIECIRGCMELWASHGLPDSMSEAKNVLNIADTLENDPWYIRFGPVMWDRLVGDNENYVEHLPTFFSMLCSLDADKFNKLLIEVFAGTKLGKEKVAELMKQAEYKDEYSSFEYDISKKQSDTTLITDEYFSEDEISKWGNVTND